jgi:hypothetical protein|tara:strand:- start:2112 stop:3113 length:1002 start_codon:yes stop_codon:yes gene_type:complete
MKLSQITKPVTAKSLNETLARRFGKKINVDTFTNEQLEDARNRLRTQLSNIETTESFDKVHTSNNYQKSKLFLDVINATIDERGTVIEGEVPAGLKAYQDKKKGKKPVDKKTAKSSNKKPDADGDGVPDWADKKNDKKKVEEKTKHDKMPHKLPKKGELTKKADMKKDKTKIKEGKEDEAELVMASKDMVDRVTGWMEDTAEMQTESMLELADAIRDELGLEQSDAFVQTVKPALEAMYDVMETTRAALTQGVGLLTGEGRSLPDTMGAEPADAAAPADADMDADMEPTVAADDFAAAAPAAGGAEDAGRAKRESLERSRRVGQILAGSKKKS